VYSDTDLESPELDVEVPAPESVLTASNICTGALFLTLTGSNFSHYVKSFP